jgi:hypothetical protein
MRSSHAALLLTDLPLRPQVSAPAYDQSNSINFAHLDGLPYNKITVAYYAGTWVNNCNVIGSGAGTVGAGLALHQKYGLKGLSIWAVS